MDKDISDIHKNVLTTQDGNNKEVFEYHGLTHTKVFNNRNGLYFYVKIKV